VTGVRAKRKTGRQTTLSVSALVSEGHRAFNDERSVCTTALDTTGFGGATFRDLLSHLHPFRSVEFGGTKSRKLKLLLNLKAAIEKGHLKLPRHGIWLILRRQLLGYRLDDRKLETDAVMALAIAWSEVERQPVNPALNPTFDYFTGSEDRVSSDPAAWGGRRVSSARLTVMQQGEN
jgi:hypothetical protein